MMSMSRGRSVTSLLSLSINSVLAHIKIYSKVLPEYLTCLPDQIKDVILKKFTSRSDKWKDLEEFNEILAIIVHPHVKKINLTCALLNDETLKILGECTKLKDIQIGGTVNTVITTQALINLFKCLPKLEILDVSHLKAFNDETIASLGANCRQIKEINANHCTNLTDFGLIELVKYTKDLRRLNVSNTQIGHDGFDALAVKHGNRLTELCMDHCKLVTDATVIVLANHCVCLEIWTLQGCPIQQRTLEDCHQLISGKKLKQVTWTVPW